MRRTVVFALAFALAACSVGPDYQRPSAATTVAYKEAANWKPATPKEAGSGQPWWSIYDDPTLDKLESQVSVSNQNLKAVEAAYRQAVAVVAENRAGFFPSIGIDPAMTRSKPAAGSFGSGRIRNSFSLPVDASWVVDIWGQVRRTVESATATAQADAAQLAAARLSAQATLAQDYFQLRVNDAQHKLLEDTVAAYTRQLRITRNKYDAGNVAKSDMAQAQATLENARSQMVALGVARAQLEHAIAVLIGQPPASFAVAPAPAPLAMQVPVVPAGVPSMLLERNPTVAQAERQMAAANAQIGVAVAGYFPSLTLSGSYGFTSSMLDTLVRASSATWSFGPQIAANVFNGGLTTAQVEAAHAAYDESVATYRQAVLTAFQGVEDNLAGLKVLQDQAQVQDAAVAAASEAERLILNQYRAGTVDYTSVVTAEATALGDRQTALTVLQSRLNASVLLVENLGGGWSSAELPDSSLPVPPPGMPAGSETKESP
ncbi:MAG: efflux transporter outer membrane subunit [Alphaproteobacteria bacterium]|nr:efflux transporter outer membrane subunit [Alphaproteobacteria bacterium]